jgi:hypothetical protein
MGIDTRRLQPFMGHASITNTVRGNVPEPFKDVWRSSRPHSRCRGR